MSINEYIDYIKKNNIYYLKQKQENLKQVKIEPKKNKIKLKQETKHEPKICSNLNLARYVISLNPTVPICVYILFDSSILIEIPQNCTTLKLPNNLYIKDNKIYDKNSNFYVIVKRSIK